MRFHDREQAGDLLAERLREAKLENPLILGLPRGGVVVAARIARALGAPMDVLVSRKIGAPMQPEFGLGAIAEGGAVWVDRGSARSLGVDDDELSELAAHELAEVERRVQLYRGGRSLPGLGERTVVLVDDGIATGGTVRAALRALREEGARQIVLAVPVAAADTFAALSREADEVICLTAPENLWAIGGWYEDFHQCSDDEVLRLLDMARPHPSPLAASREVRIGTRDAVLEGTLTLPAGAPGVVLFAHGSGSSRFSPRNRYVAAQLSRAGLGTLLFDLLTEEEEQRDELDASLRFDIGLLVLRLVDTIDWVRERVEPEGGRIGLFGSSTGAAGALVAAAVRPDAVDAIVSRGGRPDLAGQHLARVEAPTLLIVGGDDRQVLALNEYAATQLRCPHDLTIVPGATHLFEEPGALEEVARLAAEWFGRHLREEYVEARP